jgi:hypothetical protein
MQGVRFRVSTRRLMIVIALIGLAVFAVQETFFANTIYSAGYDESRFREVRVGMISAEVEALIGPPLRKTPWGPDRNLVCWEYTAKRIVQPTPQKNAC